MENEWMIDVKKSGPDCFYIVATKYKPHGIVKEEVGPTPLFDKVSEYWTGKTNEKWVNESRRSEAKDFVKREEAEKIRYKLKKAEDFPKD